MIRHLLPFVALVLCSGCVHKRARDTQSVFHDVAAQSGLVFQHFSGASAEHYLPEIMGSGVAVFDYDNDGDLDVYLVQGDARHGNRLFRNELIPSGKLRFTDCTETAGVGYVGIGMGVATGDYDNDGFTDLYVTNFGHNVLYHNNRAGSFTDVTASAGVDDSRWSTSAAFFDYDRDGKLDLFVANYVDFSVAGNKRCYAATGEPDYCTPKAYRAVPSRLFHNLGNGKFADVTVPSNVASSYGPGLGVAFADFNGDGWPDIYVANDTAANLLWLNNHDGTFREAALEAGVAYAADGVARAGMGIAVADIDDDGLEDILVTNLVREGSTLFRNRGKGQFDDRTVQDGIARLTSGATGFGTGWLDYDNDGHLDLFIGNGAVTIVEALRGQPYPYQQQNRLLRNEPATRMFQDVTARVASDLSAAAVGRGAAFGDIDNDGDSDIVVSNNNGPVRLLLNRAEARYHWLEVRLESSASNPQAMGARVAVLRTGELTQWRRVHTDSSYLSASDPRVHFGLGANPAPATLLVEWPDGLKEARTGVKVDEIITVRRGSATK